MAHAGKRLAQLVSLEHAQSLIAKRSAPLCIEELAPGEAHERILAAPIMALRDLPANDLSMMDGYALASADGRAALHVAFAIAAGDPPSTRALKQGEAARIFTGAPLPPGADCVAMQEETLVEGDRLTLERELRIGEHVRPRGQEMRTGQLVVERGTALGAAELSLAAAAGASRVSVFARPRVAILATGSELIPVGETPQPGQLIETNSLALAQLCREAGATPILLGICRDEPREIAARLKGVEAELLITTGGASVGEHDHAQEALALLGGELIFHGVAIRPGKPTLFGALPALDSSAPRRLLLGLPGNPAAAMLCFELFARPALRLMQADPLPARPRARATLASGSLSCAPGLTFFPRGRASWRDGQLEFTPAPQQSSMQIASWAAANALAVLPPGDARIEAGELLELMLLS